MTTRLPLEDGSCDHEWELVDASFDHAFGTEIVKFMACQYCDAQRECDAGDFMEDDRYED